MRTTLVLLMALGLCVVGVAALPAVSADCDVTDPECAVEFLTEPGACINDPTGRVEKICWM